MSETAGRRRVFSRRRPLKSKRREDATPRAMAARAVSVSRATLYRWERRPAPKSRRPRRPRGRQWTRELARAIEELRNDNPMWGKRKIAILLRREGIDVSILTAGRILAHLVARGAIVLVPILRRRPGARRIRFTAKQRYARRWSSRG